MSDEVKTLKDQLEQAMQAYINRGQRIAELQVENSRLETTVFQLQKQVQAFQEAAAKENAAKVSAAPAEEPTPAE